MPVRIYDIAKKLGLESKEVLVKAKELSIAAAKVPSSSLDKISAEWLEEEIIKSNPAVAARLAPKPPEEPKPIHVEEKIVVIHAPEPEPQPPTATANAITIPCATRASAKAQIRLLLNIGHTSYSHVSLTVKRLRHR